MAAERPGAGVQGGSPGAGGGQPRSERSGQGAAALLAGGARPLRGPGGLGARSGHSHPRRTLRGVPRWAGTSLLCQDGV